MKHHSSCYDIEQNDFQYNDTQLYGTQLSGLSWKLRIMTLSKIVCSAIVQSVVIFYCYDGPFAKCGYAGCRHMRTIDKMWHQTNMTIKLDQTWKK